MKLLYLTKWGLIMLVSVITACDRPKDIQFEQAYNILWLVAEDLSPYIPPFGDSTVQTPNLSRLAAEGVRYINVYSVSGVLFPDSGGGLPASEMTIAEALKTKNYQTACIGKWHLGHLPQYLPQQHGFDHYFGIPYSNDMSPAQSDWEYAQKNFPPLPLMENNEIIETEPDQSQLTQRYTQNAVEFIEANQDQPFFLYLAHTFPHVPLYVDKENKNRSKRGLYGDVVEVLDWSVGEILNTLRINGLGENTFVIFTSDNGPWGWAGINGGSAGLLRGKKGSPWEGGFRVPTIAWMPGTVPANTTSDAIATAMDLLPTFLDMAGIPLPDSVRLDGQSILSTFTSSREVQQEVFYYRNTDLVAYRRGSWKVFIRDPDPWNDEITEGDLPLLYNLNEDPSEQFNLAAGFPDIVTDLTDFVEQHRKTIVPVPSQLDSIIWR